MTPDAIRKKKQQLSATQPDMLWLVDLCESLAKAITRLDADDFGCPVCRREDGHAERCSLPLAEAVLDGRWRIPS